MGGCLLFCGLWLGWSCNKVVLGEFGVGLFFYMMVIVMSVYIDWFGLD